MTAPLRQRDIGTGAANAQFEDPARASWTPWQLVLKAGLPGWLVLSLVQFISVVLTTMEEERSFVAVPHSVRLAQLAILAVPVAVAYRVALTFSRDPRGRGAFILGHAALAAVVAGANRPALMLASIPFVRETVMAAPDQFPNLSFLEWVQVSLLHGRGLILWITTSLSALICYLGGLGLMLAVRIALTGRDDRLRAEALRLAWTRARLHALRMQLNPHFLFNTLNTIVGLLESDPRRAAEVVVRLGDVFRRSLANGEREWCSLAEELALARDYVAIQQARFGGRLQFRVESSPSEDAVSVPTMLLQPLIENAVLHGIEDDRDTLTVWVRAVLRDGHGRLEIEVGNRTTGRLPGSGGELGVGLRNLESRLNATYGDLAQISYGPTDPSTFRVELSLPRSSHGTRAASGASP
jgi:hypothetical protein